MKLRALIACIAAGVLFFACTPREHIDPGPPTATEAANGPTDEPIATEATLTPRPSGPLPSTAEGCSFHTILCETYVEDWIAGDETERRKALCSWYLLEQEAGGGDGILREYFSLSPAAFGTWLRALSFASAVRNSEGLLECAGLAGGGTSEVCDSFCELFVGDRGTGVDGTADASRAEAICAYQHLAEKLGGGEGILLVFGQAYGTEVKENLPDLLTGSRRKTPNSSKTCGVAFETP